MPAFRDLVAQEQQILGFSPDASCLTVGEPGASDEPRVVVSTVDQFGMALSGGGIRSATFNLGVLQALAELDLLKHVDYLSTVSGGGYIGGWWSAWRRRAEPGQVFPQGQDAEYELRHLREFSKYLAPRWRITDLDSWLFVATIAAAMVPTLLATIGFVAMWAIGYYVLAELAVFAPYAWVRAGSMFVGTFLTLVIYDWLWRRRTCPELGASGARGFRLLALLASGFAAGFTTLFDAPTVAPSRMFDGLEKLSWVWQPVSESEEGLSLLLRPTGCWLLAYGALALLRYGFTRAGARLASITVRGKLDRVLARLLALGTASAVLAMLWTAGRWLSHKPFFAVPVEPLLFGFVYVVYWAWRANKVPPNAPRTRTFLAELHDLVPHVLAYLVVITGVVSIVSLLIRGHRDFGFSILELLGIATGLMLLTHLLFETAETGLHSAFRSRITRAYLGSQPIQRGDQLLPNRAVEPQASDDFPVRDLRYTGRPLHLMCCAANDLSGDPLSNLNRGARSATVSGLGLSIGDTFVPWGERSPTLGSLITASAAAFNSNMGAVSMRMGPVVRFLATALNLRLGLWLPAAPRTRFGRWFERWFPGRLFFAELLGLTRADPSRHVHLSDGGHFDNTGLYELVRRRCRFILVCDCGQDPTVAFDDVGNAIRKVRQDFDLEIRIDLDPLRPNERGLSEQHVAVGEIEYAPDDLGTLIVLKPTLTRDEPVDVQQYAARNLRFPHESTGNQFYDAAQWESYRRLGYHAALSAFAVVKRLTGDRTAGRVFAAMRARWYPTPDDLTTNILDLTARFTAFEERVRAATPAWFQLELFPELREIAGNGFAHGPEPALEDRQQVLNILVQFTQLLEDVWIACRLETHWSHPLNSGWMSYFHRWTSAPSFRMWWPILRPMFNPGLRQFARERFALTSPADDLASESGGSFGRVEPLTGEFGARLASRAWLDAGLTTPAGESRVFQYMLHLRPNATASHDLQAAVLALTEADHEGRRMAQWHANRFFVAPSLRGAGIERAFLRELLRILHEEGVREFRVELPPVDDGDAASQRARRDLLEFYAREGFVREQCEGSVLALRC